MYRIGKRFDFSASHVLEGLPEDHQCARLHGHNYTVEVELEAEHTDPEVGFIFDYGELKPIKEWIDGRLDHRHLNDCMPDNPTAENLAWWLHTIITTQILDCLPPGVRVSAVRVSETPKTWATYEP